MTRLMVAWVISAVGLAGLLAGFVTSVVAKTNATQISITHLRGPIWLVEDPYFAKENSVFYIGPSSVTLIGAGWTPQIAKLIDEQIKTITNKPVTEVVDTDFNPDRAGGNEYWSTTGAKVVSTRLSYELMAKDWDGIWESTRKGFPGFPQIRASLPTTTYPGDFELQGGKILAIYLGPSHMPDDIFVYFPNEKVLYGGNILKEQPGNLASADIQEYAVTLARLKNLNLPTEVIISGHWSPVHGPELVDTYLGFLRTQARGVH